jgi:hypothetical protein
VAFSSAAERLDESTTELLVGEAFAAVRQVMPHLDHALVIQLIVQVIPGALPRCGNRCSVSRQAWSLPSRLGSGGKSRILRIGA